MSRPSRPSADAGRSDRQRGDSRRSQGTPTADSDSTAPEVESRTIKLRILDRGVQLACRADQEDDLLEAAAYVDASMRDLRQRNASSSIEKIAIVTAINLAGDLLKARQADGDQQALGRQLQQVNDDIETLLAAHAGDPETQRS